MTMVGRKPYLGAAAAAVLVAAAPDGIGMPGITGTAEFGAFRGVAPSADASGLLGVAIKVQDGGTDTGPSMAALPRPAEMPLPAPPSPDSPEIPGTTAALEPSPPATPAGTMLPTPFIPAPRNEEPVTACTTWAGLNAPLEETVFQKLLFNPKPLELKRPDPDPSPVRVLRIPESPESPDVVEVVAPPDARVCSVVGTLLVSCDRLNCTPVPAELPAAALTAADWPLTPAELVVWAGAAN